MRAALNNEMSRYYAADRLDQLAVGSIGSPHDIASVMDRIACNASIPSVDRHDLLVQGVAGGRLDADSRYLASFEVAAQTLREHHVKLGEIGIWLNLPLNKGDDWLQKEIAAYGFVPKRCRDDQQDWTRRNVRLFGQLVGALSGTYRGLIAENLYEQLEAAKNNPEELI